MWLWARLEDASPVRGGVSGRARAARRSVVQVAKAICKLRMRMRLCASACHSSTARVLSSPRTLKLLSPRRRNCALAHSTVAPRWIYSARPKSLRMKARHCARAGVSVGLGSSGSIWGLRLRGAGTTGWVPRSVSSSMACSFV